MSLNTISGIEKEPDEVKPKGIDLATNYLETEEDVNEFKIFVYKVVSKTLKQFDLTNVQYITIKTLDSNKDVVQEETEWEMADAWNSVKFLAQSTELAEEVTSDIIVPTDNDNPNQWVKKVDDGKFKLNIQNGEVGETYHAIFKFTTDAERVEKLHFPITITEVRGF